MTKRKLVWDTTHNVYYKFEKCERPTMPCALTTHDYYRTDLQRWHLGIETLVQQGFPRDVKVASPHAVLSDFG